MQHDGSYNRTVFFNVEDVGTHTIRVDHKLEMSSIPHVNTRESLEYNVHFPHDKDIGIWFETDWSGEKIVVMQIRKGCYAYNETDIQIGDVLLAVENLPVKGENFEDAMKVLQNRSRTMTVTLRTVEENIRLVRENAMTKVTGATSPSASSVTASAPNSTSSATIKPGLHGTTATRDSKDDSANTPLGETTRPTSTSTAGSARVTNSLLSMIRKDNKDSNSGNKPVELDSLKSTGTSPE